MTTKDQERAALAKIQKIVSDLGEDSYLRFAFTGAFTLANLNIEEDAAYTTSFYVDGYRTGLKIIEDLNERIHALETRNLFANQIETLERQLSDARGIIGKQQDKVVALTDTVRNTSNRWAESQAQVLLLESNLESKGDEIIRLKAKLYDLLAV